MSRSINEIPNLKLHTISGAVVNPRSPKAKDMGIRDIAHALNNLCRFAGHLKQRYSVAAHSLAVSSLIEQQGGSPLDCLTGLLHDASEAYLVDLPTPVKNLCPDYRKLEARFQKQVCKRFSLPYPFPKIVHVSDKAVLAAEMLYQQFGVEGLLDYLGRDCTKEFLRRFFELGGRE